MLIKLNEVVSLEVLQHQYLFHRSLSRAYRVFTDLVHFQCKKENLFVLAETRDALILATIQARQTLPKEVQVRFEYSCASEAAKRLPTSGKIAKYIDSGLSLGSNIEARSICGTLKGIKDLHTELKKEWHKKWHSDVQTLRWQSTLIKDIQSFANIFSPYVLQFEEKEKNTLSV